MGQTPENELVTVELEEDRYHRLRLIPWWDQDRLRQARVMVVGAGALGNEILKSLALLGIGKIMVLDLDRIEDSNLTRAILFRHQDQGDYKAEVAARRVCEVNPDVIVQPVVGDVNYDLGLGVFREMDLVIGALDNREARVTINANCWKLGVPWIDGAIELMQGVARVFIPSDEAACYECTMSELDYKLLSQRRSCALLSRDDVLAGKVPTTPTIASIIGGIQVQEAIKLLHADRGLPVLSGSGFVYNGLTNDSYVVQYQRRHDCPAHEHMFDISELPRSVTDLTGAEAVQLARTEVGPQAVVEFERELCTHLHCPRCQITTEYFRSLGRVSLAEARCPECGEIRDPRLTHCLSGHEDFLERTLADLGLPLYDIITARQGLTMRRFLLADDRSAAMGAIA
ncbi:MAG: ThiF family adenylyltransferase [Armatimonadetes bacterium]|nr:ThiF family adenylyltransferase [Armatimonadota bacterium]